MEALKKGQFFGKTKVTTILEGITLTDTEYTHPKVDWHFHETPYFTFLLAGNLIEGNKKEVYHCGSGSLLFHNWQEPHYNIKPNGYARGFHMEIDACWLKKMEFDLFPLQGSLQIHHPDLKFLMYKILRETRLSDKFSEIAIHQQLMHSFDALKKIHHTNHKNPPLWVKRLKEVLFDQEIPEYTLTELAALLEIHPVHLSRGFSSYFNCTFGEYIRKIKVEKAFSLMHQKGSSLTEIAFRCGFSDQSHFIRCFRDFTGESPKTYARILNHLTE